VSLKRDELIRWLQQRQDEWINLEIKVGRTGKWYASVDNWKPKGGSDGWKPQGRSDGNPFRQ